MSRSKIDWCTHVSNCFAGCRHGCNFCYARKFANRFSGNEKTLYAALKRKGLDCFDPVFSPDKLRDLDMGLSRAKKPRRIFLGSMGDLGGEWFYEVVQRDKDGKYNVVRTDCTANEVRLEVINVIAKHPRHKFLLLTKNPVGFWNLDWPDNAWVGTSVTNVLDARLRIPHLRRVNANTRWVSVEPLLDPNFMVRHLFMRRSRPVNWVVVGALTGNKDHFPRLDAAKQIVEWCKDNDVPCFVKDNMRKAEPTFDWPREFPV